MQISELLTDAAVLAEIGARIARYRLDRQLTQTALAAEAGISKRTVERIEAGASVQLVNLIRVCRALGLVANLEQMIPEPAASPMDLLRRQGKVRQRASSPPKDGVQDEPWSWDDEA